VGKDSKAGLKSNYIYIIYIYIYKYYKIPIRHIHPYDSLLIPLAEVLDNFLQQLFGRPAPGLLKPDVEKST
jgi:hypothetical protein